MPMLLSRRGDQVHDAQEVQLYGSDETRHWLVASCGISEFKATNLARVAPESCRSFTMEGSRPLWGGFRVINGNDSPVF